jgi:hypothetical protein
LMSPYTARSPGLIFAGITRWLGIDAAKLVRFRNSIYCDVLWVIYVAWDALGGRF